MYTRQFTKTKPHSELLEQYDLSDVKESDTEVKNIGMYYFFTLRLCIGLKINNKDQVTANSNFLFM